MRDIRPDAVKIGLIGSNDLVPLLSGLMRAFEGPVVLDPVLAAGGGYDLDRGEIAALIADQLLPWTTLITPNRAEARRLGGQVRLMFPMITTLEEMRRVRGMVRRAARQLAQEKMAPGVYV